PAPSAGTLWAWSHWAIASGVRMSVGKCEPASGKTGLPVWTQFLASQGPQTSSTATQNRAWVFPIVGRSVRYRQPNIALAGTAHRGRAGYLMATAIPAISPLSKIQPSGHSVGSEVCGSFATLGLWGINSVSIG